MLILSSVHDSKFRTWFSSIPTFRTYDGVNTVFEPSQWDAYRAFRRDQLMQEEARYRNGMGTISPRPYNIVADEGLEQRVLGRLSTQMQRLVYWSKTAF